MREKNLSSKWVGINAPRYTSYPTAPNFNNKIDEKIYRNWLSRLKESSTISLYVHIPFCKKLCWFCGCTTSIVNHYQPIKSYLELLLKEIELVAANIDKKKNIVTNIHFGGGSPTILSIEDFSLLISSINKQFAVAQKPEISIEIDPRNITEEKIKLYSDIGVNRVSIGVQDFNHQTQLAVNRIQPFEMVENIFNQLRINNIHNINADLIYGLPCQTTLTIKDTINKIIKLQPKRIALFSYAHVPWMKDHHRLIDEKLIASNEERLKMFILSSAMLGAAGYNSIGIDHFALPEDELLVALKEKTLRRNFQGYTSDQSDSLIGLGLSSIGQTSHGYVQNFTSNKEYKNAIENGILPIAKGKKISKADKIRKEVIDALMCFMEVDLSLVIKKYNLSDSYFDQELKLIKEQYADLVEINKKYIKFNSPYKMIVRMVASVFDKYFTNKENRYSKVM